MLSFAFSTLSTPTWDLVTTAGRALEWGVAGVELVWAAGGPERLGSVAGDLAIADPAKAREILDAGQIRVACLAASIAFSGKSRLDDGRADKVRLAIEAAREMASPIVKILDAPVHPGLSLGDLGLRMGEWLAPLGDYARDRGVALLVENVLAFRRAADLWPVMDRLDHPAIGCAWNVHSAWQAGETPGVSVSVLNSRIRYARVRDAHEQESSTPCAIGDGAVPIAPFLHRLRGIGYSGWVTLDLTGTDPEATLPAGLKRVKEWTHPVPGAAKSAPKAPPKAAARH
jgi:sugar phosphate isomerase/epimerase